MAVCSYVEVLYQKQGQLSIALVGLGKQCVITVGIIKMLLWFVDNWDSQQLVIRQTTCACYNFLCKHASILIIS